MRSEANPSDPIEQYPAPALAADQIVLAVADARRAEWAQLIGVVEPAGETAMARSNISLALDNKILKALQKSHLATKVLADTVSEDKKKIYRHCRWLEEHGSLESFKVPGTRLLYCVDHREYAVGFGRGLQAVNILRNRAEDLARGVDFFPDGWREDDLRCYAERNLTLAEAYVETLSRGPANDFCRLPLSLARATLNALSRGEPKLSRSAVLEIVKQVRSADREGLLHG